MPNQWNQFATDDDDDDDEGQNAKGFRSHLAKVEKENKELRATNDKLLTQVRMSTITQVLTTKGVNTKIARLVPADVEPTVEAVEKWLEDNAELFPITKTTAPLEGETSATSETAGQGATEGDGEGGNADAGQMGRIAAAVNGATAPTKQGDLMATLKDKSLSHEKLLELIHAAGGGAGVG